MTLTLSRLQQAHSKVARTSGTLAIAMSCKRLSRMDLHAAVDDLKGAIANIEDILNAKD